MKMKKFLSVLIVCVLILPALTVGVSAAVPYDNMIALYNMEGELKDSVSGGTGTLWNGASIVSDPERGNVLHLNNDDITAPGEGLGYAEEGQWAELAAPYIPDSDEMSVSIWFKVKEFRTWARAIDMGDANAQNALANGETATIGPNRFLNISPTNGEYTIGTININDSDLGIPNNRDRVFADLVDENAWVHAVYVIAKDGTPNVLYVNGVPFESTHNNAGDDPEPAEFSPKDILAAPEGLRNVFLGRSAYENNGDQIMNGYIDDVTIFNVALTAEQVKELMQADLKNGNPAAVVDEPAPVDAVGGGGEENPHPVAAATPAPVSAPATSDSFAMMAALLAISLIGSAIYARNKKTRV